MAGDSWVRRLLELGIGPAEAARLRDGSPEPLRGIGGDPDTIFAPARHKVAMLFTSRSGTTFFVDALRRTGVFGEFREHFSAYRQRTAIKHWGSATMADYVAQLVQHFVSPSGVFGFKGTVEALLPLAQVGELPEHAEEWTWITVRRRDLIAQAVSLYRAKATKVWHSTDAAAASTPAPPYDYAGIEKQLEIILRKQGQIERFLTVAGLTPLRLVYEDFRDDPTDALQQVFDAVGLAAPANLAEFAHGGRFSVMADEISRTYAERFAAELGRKLRPET